MRERSIFGLIIVTIALIAVGYLTATQVDFSGWLPFQASSRAVLVDRLFRLMMGIAVVVFLLVEGALLFAVIRFRRKAGDESEGKPIHGNNTLEVIWTLIPAVVVAVIGIYAYQVLTTIERQEGKPLVVRVIARQFAWEFEYPEAEITSSVLHLPVNEPVLFQIESKDVIHSFWVPAFRVKRDATPGQIDDLVITPTLTGEFPIRCAELCGAGHAAMTSKAIVEPREAFDAWLAANGKEPAPEPSAQAEASESATEKGDEETEADEALTGPQVFLSYGCGACHTLTDAGGFGAVAPALDGIGTRAGSTVEGLDARGYITQSILEPNAHIAEGFFAGLMPQDFGDRMSPEELSTLVDYLLTQ